MEEGRWGGGEEGGGGDRGGGYSHESWSVSSETVSLCRRPGEDAAGEEVCPRHFGLAIYTVAKLTPDDLIRHSHRVLADDLKCQSLRSLQHKAKEAAATKIQAKFRGNKARKSLAERLIRNPKTSGLEDVAGGDVIMEDATEVIQKGGLRKFKKRRSSDQSADNKGTGRLCSEVMSPCRGGR